MPNPSNPFAAIAAGHKDGRGRSTNGRSTPYQNRNVKPRGRGRGGERGGGGGGRPGGGSTPSDTQKEQERPSGTSLSNSPFAQLKSNAPSGNTTTSQFGKPSSFAGNTKPETFRAPSLPQTTFGNSVDRSRHPPRRPAPQKPARINAGMSMSSVPVDDSDYHDRYEKLKLDRAKQRERAIRQGQMADPNQPTSLKKAITPVGTCTSMCPEFERVERIVQKMVDRNEKHFHPETNSYHNMESKMLKRFRRSAAGYDEQLPSDIRTPKTLLQTMNYLIRHIIGGPEPLGLIHKFVWDRTRSIRNDFSVQQLTQEDHVRVAVTCLERIARFHILSLHLLSSPENQEQFDHHQEREQLNNTMLSLMYYYDDNRDRITFPYEEEFRAYYIIFAIHDQRPDLESRVQKWPKELLQSPKVKVALELFAAASNTWEYQGTLDEKRPNAIAQGFYTRFFGLVNSPSVSYLMACVAEIYFNNVRQTAIRSIWKAYCRSPASQQHKNEEWTLDELTQALYFDDDAQTQQFCEENGLSFAENSEGELYLDWGNRPVDSIDFQPSSQHAFSETYVETKRGGRTLPAIILGLNIRQAASRGMIDRSLLTTTASSQLESVSEASEEDGLFVSEEENEISEANVVGNGESQQAESESPESGSSVHESETGLVTANIEDDKPRNPFQQPAAPAGAKPTFSSIFSSPSIASNPFAALQETSSIFSRTPAPSATPNIQNDAKPAAPSQFQLSPTAQPFSIKAAIADGTPPPESSEKSGGIFDSVKTNNIFPNTPANQPASGSFGGGFSLFQSNGDGRKTEQAPITLSETGTTPLRTEAGSALLANKPLSPPAAAVTSGELKQQTAESFTQPLASTLSTVHPSPDATPTGNEDSRPEQPIPKPAVTAGPPLLPDPKPTASAVVENSHTPPVEPPAPAAETGASPPVSDSPSSPDSAQFRKSWIEALRQSIVARRHDIPASRKRPLDEPEEEPLSIDEISPPPSEVSKPEPARPKRKSLALASIAPLPTLPILEEVERMTKRKPPPEVESESPAQSQIDQDELLLSAARIAAESLKNGPKLFDGLSSNYAYSPGPSSRASQWLERSLHHLSGKTPRSAERAKSHLSKVESSSPSPSMGVKKKTKIMKKKHV